MIENNYQPPFTISDRTINLISSISGLVAEATIQSGWNSNPRLKKRSRVKTIQASLAIENNSLNINQVTDVMNGKRVLGPQRDICEVMNAFDAYELLLKLDPYSQKDMLSAHEILMYDLTKEAGKYRSGEVGIYAGEKLVHMAPKAEFVPEHMSNLISWVKDTEVHPLIASCVFHYELEFIHPFTDGNGRMGRMWQTLILYQWKELFGWLPIETLIKERQTEYYSVLGECDKLADSGRFVEFILQAIQDTLSETLRTEQVTEQATEQVEKLLEVLESEELTGKEIMERLGLKHRPSFRKRYLIPALELGLVEMTIPEKPNSKLQKYRKAL